MDIQAEVDHPPVVLDFGWLVLLAVVAGLGALTVERLVFRGGLFTGRFVEIPRRLVVHEDASAKIPVGARRPLDYLADRLVRLGFRPAGLPLRVPAAIPRGQRLLVVPFIHTGECAIFLMGIHARLPRTELMLHILTPLTNGRRVETSTLPALRLVRPPEHVDARIVTDASTIEEVWSQHRRALTEYERKERVDIQDNEWKAFVARAYDSWIEAAVRASRVELAGNGQTYRLRRFA